MAVRIHGQPRGNRSGSDAFSQWSQKIEERGCPDLNRIREKGGEIGLTGPHEEDRECVEAKTQTRMICTAPIEITNPVRSIEVIGFVALTSRDPSGLSTQCHNRWIRSGLPCAPTASRLQRGGTATQDRRQLLGDGIRNGRSLPPGSCSEQEVLGRDRRVGTRHGTTQAYNTREGHQIDGWREISILVD